MSAPYPPTILYPNGGETILSSEIIVRWESVTPVTDDGRSVEYDLYFTDNFDPDKEPEWKKIATVPESLSQFVWRVGSSIRSQKCRVGITARNSRGERSRWSISADNFAIRRKKLDTPTILSPTNGERFDKTVDIILDDLGLVGTPSERSFYQIYYSSSKADVPSTSVAQNVPVGSGTVVWNTLDLDPADDYQLQVYLADDDGNISDSAFVKNIDIAHEGFFIIDTVPPVAAIVVNENDVFTRSQGVSVKIMTYDEATAVHSIQLTDNITTSVPEPVTDVAHFTLSSGDDVKTVQLLAQDYGANRTDQDTYRLFETFVETTSEIADIDIDAITGTTWIVTGSPSNSLYKFLIFPVLSATFTNEPTAVGAYSSYVYVGVKTTSNTGTLMRYDGYSATTVNAFTSADSIINAFSLYDDKLIMGLENGQIYSFDGITLAEMGDISDPVKTFSSDGNLLFVVGKNSTDVFVYNGAEFISTGAG